VSGGRSPADGDDADAPPAALTHVDADGAARMVDVSGKPPTAREARAGGAIRMSAATLDAIQRHAVAKGDVLAVARVAGIMAAKRTPELVPLCHPLPLTGVEVRIVPDAALPGLRVEAVVRTTGPTGVEMEALTAASVTLLTIYDMAKALDPAMEIGYLTVLSKIGGKSGAWQRA
jgi:cyclic pyranopterin phosphate synthase